MSNDQLNILTRVFSFEKKIRDAQTLIELQYVITNELRTIAPFVHAFFGRYTDPQNFSIEAASDVTVVDSTSATTSLAQTIMQEVLYEGSTEIHSFTLGKADRIPAKNEKPLPPNLLWVPCFSSQRGPQGVMLLMRNEDWTEQEIEFLKHLSSTIGHAIGSFSHPKWSSSILENIRNKYVQTSIFALIVLAMFLPVTLSTIGQVEVIPKDPDYINSPLDGVIEEILIENNDDISKQQPLLVFDPTQFQNSYDVALQELRVVETEILQARQSSFQSKNDKALVAQLQSKIALAQEKLSYQKLLLDKTKLSSPSAGVAVVQDKSLIIGKPFQIGETIMVIADPNKILVEIMVPVKDSITIKKDAPVNIFLDSDPLNSLDAKVIKFSYHPELTPEGILAYRVTAELIDYDNLPRIGLRGSAKIYGDKVSLFFYLFRKPILFVRQSLGI